MRTKVRNKLLRLTTILLVAGAASLAPLATATPPAAGAATAPLRFDIGGRWTDVGLARPSISVGGSDGRTIVVDMSYAGRPLATGSVQGPTTIIVTFPDAGTYWGELEGTNVIRWSNNTTWQKVYTGTIAFDLNAFGVWGDGATFAGVTNSGGFVNMSLSTGRPNAYGFVVDAQTIAMVFPDSGTYLATISPSGYLWWSDGAVWYFFVIEIPPVTL